MDIFSVVPFLRTLIDYWPFNKYRSRPKIFIEMNGSRKQKYSPTPSDENPPVVPFNSLIADFPISWFYNLLIRNNGDQDCYFLRLLHPPLTKINIEPKINYHDILKASDKKEYTAKYHEIFHGTGDQSVSRMNDRVLTAPFIFEYKNLKGKSFYTVYNHDESPETQNTLYTRLPKKYRKILKSRALS